MKRKSDLPDKIKRCLRARELGKKHYTKHRDLLEQIVREIEPRHEIMLGDGTKATLIDQFAEIPVIIAASPMIQTQGNNRMNVYPVVVIEKARGRLIFDKQIHFDHQSFMNLTVNHKNGTIDLTKPNCRIAIFPDDSATVAAP
jgi:hypothetical protein